MWSPASPLRRTPGSSRTLRRKSGRTPRSRPSSRPSTSASPRLSQRRKSLDDFLAIVLIAAAALFLASAKLAGGLARPAAAADGPAGAAQSRPQSGARSSSSRAASNGEEELPSAFVDRIVQQHGRSKEAAIPILQAIQSHYRYLPDEALQRVCELTEITPAQIAGTSSFYAQFRRSPVGKHIVRVCHGTACHVSGARQITEELRRRLEIPDGADTDPQRMFTVDEVACLGCCSLAPVIMVDDQTVGKLTPATACEALDGIRSPSLT